MTKPTILLVDLSNQLWRSAHVFSGLTHDGVFTGGLYGVLLGYSHAMLDVGATRLVLCLDTKPYLRSRDYPEYKKLSRTEVDEDLAAAVQQSRRLVLDMCAELRIPTWGIKGFESDDLIGHVVMRDRHRYNLIVAQSNDSDLGQLFWHERFRIHKGVDKKTKRAIILDRAAFFADKFSITPDQYVKALAYSGTHNDVAGVSGIGPAKSAKAVVDAEKWRAVVRDHGPMLARNEALIRLPHAEFPGNEPIPKNVRVNRQAFTRFLARYNIQPTTAMLDAVAQIGYDTHV